MQLADQLAVDFRANVLAPWAQVGSYRIDPDGLLSAPLRGVIVSAQSNTSTDGRGIVHERFATLLLADDELALALTGLGQPRTTPQRGDAWELTTGRNTGVWVVQNWSTGHAGQIRATVLATLRHALAPNGGRLAQ